MKMTDYILTNTVFCVIMVYAIITTIFILILLVV